MTLVLAVSLNSTRSSLSTGFNVLEALSPIDFRFAQRFVSSLDPSYFFVAYLFASARRGHLCVQKEGDRVFPDFCSLDSKEQSVLCSGFDALSLSLCVQVESIEESVSSPFCRCKNSIYLQRNWDLHRRFVQELLRLQKGRFLPMERQEVCFLHVAQKQAVENALTFPVSIITGGPGTGKSYTACAILRAFLAKAPKPLRVFVMAPTGKAASLLEGKMRPYVEEEGIEFFAGTIHSFVQKGPFYADLLFMEEASMVDASIFCSLLASLCEGGRVVLLGDKEQLPPVESGSFFIDILAQASALSIPVAELFESVRIENPSLLLLAEAVRSVDEQALRSHPYVTVCPTIPSCVVSDVIRQKCGEVFVCEDPSDAFARLALFRVLSCVNKGPFGVDAINEYIGNILMSEQVLVPALITKNTPTLDLYNGDSVFIRASLSFWKYGDIKARDEFFFIDKTTGSIQSLSLALLPSFSLGYCQSVHKSQGSEYEETVLLAPKGSEFLGREVLYTAVTRSKKKCHLWIEEIVMQQILFQSSKKLTGLYLK